jgi:hypothetical protein
MLHVDAKGIFGDDTVDPEWDSQYDVKYKSYKQAYRHTEREMGPRSPRLPSQPASRPFATLGGANAGKQKVATPESVPSRTLDLRPSKIEEHPMRNRTLHPKYCKRVSHCFSGILLR